MLIWLYTIAVVTLVATRILVDVYRAKRKPDWPETPARIPIPYAYWIIGGILALVVGLFAYLLAKDPLQHH